VDNTHRRTPQLALIRVRKAHCDPRRCVRSQKTLIYTLGSRVLCTPRGGGPQCLLEVLDDHRPVPDGLLFRSFRGY